MADETTEARSSRKVREGIVISTKMDKTVVVAVVDRVRHRRYGKTLQRTNHLYAHDETNDANEGDRVRVVLHNQLPESTSIHFHGLELPNAMDGVPFVTQPPVKPGESFTYEFTVPNAGSHMYHSHHNAAKQVGLGLLGAFIVEPKEKAPHDAPDVDEVLILNDGAHGYTFNGKSFPATKPIVAKLGQTVRIRFMNEGMMIHPMHLHGMHMTVIAKDGWPVPAPWKCDTLNVAPGERWDAIVHCTNPGTWAFHCHILPHAESDHGMFGMVTALVVQK